ncbi:MAG: hypothetical protein IK145_07430 [Bacteroidales bacterium]|jgi:hypothetical protein|nr:hypothetical protein [Bacteroidales bacterium]MBR5397664.1 hypothetical protein [Bacteroidales bacterium]MCR5132646.1 energy transducer TonB [Bacteroidales bacterium]
MTGEDRAGLYITVIFHLLVIIVLLASQISSALRKGESFLIDFSKQEIIEEKKKEENLKEEVKQKLDRMLDSYAGVPIRNIAVDRSSTLKDDRNTNAEELYKEAERLARELENGYEIDEPDDYIPISKPVSQKKEPQKKQQYSGPSVVSYDLAGRKASRLSIPAYRCFGAGHVTVIITVDPSGNVVNAKIQEDVSSNDKCLRDFAIRAARTSKFSASSSAPPRQIGNIVYMFIAQ